MTIIRSLAVAAMACPVLLAAQTEPITIRLTPSPNQTVHMRMTQEAALEIEPAGDGAPMPIPAMKLGLAMTMAMTMAVGAPNEQGRIDARLTYDDVQMDTTINGSPAPLPNPLAQIAGRIFTISYDEAGKIVDMTSDPPNRVFDAMKPMMSNLFGATDPMTLAVGETITRPTNLALPLPSAGAAAMTAETRYTLRSVTYEGADRIAHLTTVITAQMKQQPAGTAAAAPMFDTQITGEGTLDVNVERGYMKAGEQRIAISATIGGRDSGGTAPPAMRMHGTMKMVQTTEPD